jgi:hypothetical protein
LYISHLKKYSGYALVSMLPLFNRNRNRCGEI